ncbi:hypothetical protein [Saccharibacillus endophyticus]|uniref:Uncharacterized protein n=1 Tax=Saccharibacillus endophyticus TaxID=2060666 RepID=A0ABQ1ZRG5_9BACL|nr:hypothetical protein [Saccharibacillus endophyticus]GGH76713.1 hypothetical protein GCM10007362_19370 [Saccharibacillus endophyticus]
MATTSGSAQDIQTQPLTLEQIHDIQENNRIAAVLPVSLQDVSDLSPEELADHLSIQLTDSDLLTDVQFERVGVQDENTVLMKVSGDVTMLLETLELFSEHADEEDEEEDEDKE